MLPFSRARGSAEQFRKNRGDLRLQANLFVGQRVSEEELQGVESHPGGFLSVARIPYHRMAQPGQVGADLMAAAGLQLDLEQRPCAARF